MFIHIRPDETEALARIPEPLLFPAPGAPKGHLLLGFNERGECPMLREGCCSIYQHRPQTCRDFDCRVLAATGITPADDGPQSEIARRARSWRFDFASAEDQEQFNAVRAAGAFLREQRDAFPPESLPRMPVQLAILAVEVYEIFAARGLRHEGELNDSEIARQVLASMAARHRGDPVKPKERSVRATKRHTRS
jgi:Fe-S-cluster containining protein